MLIQFAVGCNNRVLLVLNLREDIPHRGLGLPRPVKTCDAAGKQLPGLLKLRFLRVYPANSGFNPCTIFPPQIEIPARAQTKSTVGVPRSGGSRRRIGYRKGPHQPFGRHFLPFSIR